MKSIMETIDRDFAGKAGKEYAESCSSFIHSYMTAMEYLRNSDRRTFGIFSRWMNAEGIGMFSEVFGDILHDKLDGRFRAFMEIYKSYLDDSIKDGCMQPVLDFLYLIPEKMKSDFRSFGFLRKAGINA